MSAPSCRVQRHADTHGGHQRAPVHDHRCIERLVDALGGLAHLPGVCHTLQYDDELVPTHAHHDILGAHGRAHALRDGLQELVAGLVSARIVDVLEMIEIQEQHREHVAGLFGRFDVARQVGRQIQAIGEPRELIVVREVIELLMALEQRRLGLAADRDVMNRHPEELFDRRASADDSLPRRCAVIRPCSAGAVRRAAARWRPGACRPEPAHRPPRR